MSCGVMSTFASPTCSSSTSSSTRMCSDSRKRRSVVVIFDSCAGRCARPIVASSFSTMSYPAARTPAIAPAIFSESATESLIACPSSRSKAFKLSSSRKVPSFALGLILWRLPQGYKPSCATRHCTFEQAECIRMSPWTPAEMCMRDPTGFRLSGAAARPCFAPLGSSAASFSMKRWERSLPFSLCTPAQPPGSRDASLAASGSPRSRSVTRS